jgi:hypothetical protein
MQLSDDIRMSDDVWDEDVWDDNLPPSSSQGAPRFLNGTYIANPDSSFFLDNISVNKPQLLYQSSERLKVTMWNEIKENEFYYLTLYVSNF